MRNNWLFKLRLTFECIRMEIDRLLNPDLSSFYPMNDDGTFRFKLHDRDLYNRTYYIPTTRLSEKEAQDSLAKLISDYSGHVTFNDATGEIYIDGKKNISYEKEYWFGTPDNKERPIIEPLTDEDRFNPEVIWFKSKLKKDLN